jgi:hypothetical protein
MLPLLFAQAVLVFLITGNVITFHHLFFSVPAVQIVLVFRPWSGSLVLTHRSRIL